MKIVLLSGGKGTRLWPISTNEIPKQFFKSSYNSKTMLNTTYENISHYLSPKDIFIATNTNYKTNVVDNIGSYENIIEEPSTIGTFGAILNIAVYLKYEKNLDNDIIAVLPVDHYVTKDFYKILFAAEKQIINSESDICLIGVKPTYPATDYGYILQNGNIVKKFIEKPNQLTAIELIAKNALWNSGILLFKLQKIFNVAQKYSHFDSYKGFIKKYERLPHTSFDYEFLEKEQNILVIESKKIWDDIGTWEHLSTKFSNCDPFNTNIINFENKEVKNQGVPNTILVNSKNGILILPKSNHFIKNNYGFYEILSTINKNITIKREIITTDNEISFTNNKKEFWHIIKGTGKLTYNNNKIEIKPTTTIEISTNQKYFLKSYELLELIIIEYN